MTGSGLDAHVVVRRRGIVVDVALAIRRGETVAVVGPNGAGKTTLVRALAGLARTEGGHVRIDGRDVGDVPPEHRPVGVVFQQPLLLPGRTALENVAYGLRHRLGRRPDHARAEAAVWLDRLGLAEHADARGDRLSGGEAQRVALARALATDPALLLLDEPLASLDAATRVLVRHELRRHLADSGAARLLVTHDPADATALAERLVVVEAGRVTQTGTAADLAAAPATAFVAELVGTNRYEGIGDGQGRIELPGGATLVVPSTAHGPTVVMVDPRSVALHREEPAGSARNTWPGHVGTVEVVGGRARVRVVGPIDVVAEVTPAAVVDLALGPGTPVWASVKAVEIRVL